MNTCYNIGYYKHWLFLVFIMIDMQFFSQLYYNFKNILSPLIRRDSCKIVGTRMYHFLKSRFGQQFCAPIGSYVLDFTCNVILHKNKINSLSRKDNNL